MLIDTHVKIKNNKFGVRENFFELLGTTYNKKLEIIYTFKEQKGL